MDYITKIETILICNNFRPNGIDGFAFTVAFASGTKCTEIARFL